MKKLLTSLLCVMMVVCFMPAMAWAEGDAAAATLPDADEDGIITISENGSYEISENLTASIVIEAGADVTLTVNGTLTNNAGSDTITVEKSAKLTIKGTGTVDNITHAKAAVLNNGETIINGGTFTRSQENGQNKGDNGENSFYAILNHGTMTIDGEGVTVSQNGHYSSLIENGYQNYKSGISRTGYVENENSLHPTLTIVEGTFNGGLNTIKNDDGGILEINGGTFSNTTQASLLNWNIATITGGNFDCTSDNEVFGNYNAILVGCASTNTYNDECLNQGKLTIQGGTFTSTNEVIEQMNGSNGNGDVDISGGTFISEGNDVISSEMTDQTTITSGIFSSKVSAADNTEVISITSGDDSKLYYVGASITDEVLADAVENGASVADATADGESAVYVVAFNYADDITETAYVIADENKNYQISEPDKPARNGYTFLGWYNGDQLFDFNQTVSSNVVLTAKWSKNVYIPTLPTTPTTQKPVIEPNADVTTSLSTDGTALTIKANDGYEITDVTVNGVSKGAVTTLTGLKTGDKIVITTKKIETPDDNAALIEAVKNTKLIARSAMSTAKGKKAVKVSWYAEDGSDLDFDGYEVFRSLKRYSGFGTTPIFKTSNEKYYNTAIKKGNKYYYKVRAYKVIDGEKVYTDWSTKAWRTVK